MPIVRSTARSRTRFEGGVLVIACPPGIGKSQTITNLIAAALVRGKTVLFVAEKLAALEVVRRRLDDAGLGMFCLEVHSGKTKQGALINNIALRFSALGTFQEPPGTRPASVDCS